MVIFMIFHTTCGREGKDKSDTWCNVKLHSILAKPHSILKGCQKNGRSFCFRVQSMIDRHVRLFPLRGLCSGCWQLYRTLCGTLGKQSCFSFTITWAKVFPTCNTIISLTCHWHFSFQQGWAKEETPQGWPWWMEGSCFSFVSYNFLTIHPPCGSMTLVSGVWCCWMGCSRGWDIIDGSWFVNFENPSIIEKD